MSGSVDKLPTPAVGGVFCHSCGERLPDSAKFCGKCGKSTSQPTSEPKDFFISYSSRDVGWATWIAQQLEASGYTTIYQARDFFAGGNLILQVHQAIRTTKRTVAVISQEYLRSRYCAPEWAEMARRDPTDEYGLLLPVRVRECDVDRLFGSRGYVDLVEVDQVAASARLLEGARHAVSKGLPPTPFPAAALSPMAWPLVVAPTGLPLAASLIGREVVLGELLARLREGTTCNVFALEGIEGVGKTALAAEAVARLAEDQHLFPGGVVWIACDGLAGKSGLAELWAKVARALQLEQVAVEPHLQKRCAVLVAALAQGQRLLLAFDNIEPTLEVKTVLETLAVRGHTTLLLTSRQRVAANQVAAFELAPLKIDGAWSLFLERLAQAGGSPPSPAEATALDALLEEAGGLPLALELAAAYAGVQRLGLTSEARGVENDNLNAFAFHADPRLILLTYFERSWAALSADQQRLFAGLSLLGGVSFPRAAALAIAEAEAGNTNLPEVENDPKEDLAMLVNYALVAVLPDGKRLRLHPLLREYAAEKLKRLAPAQQALLGNAMVAYWLSYARVHAGYEGMDALEAEDAGLMGAVAWADEHAQHRAVLGLARALRQAWNVRGRQAEEWRLYTWANSAAQKLGDIREQRWASHQLAVMQHQMGRMLEAQAGYERALALAWQVGDLAAERDEVYALALLEKQQGRLSAARAGYEQALALARQSGDLVAEWEEVHALALLDHKMGQFLEARAGYKRALALARQLREPQAEAIALGNFGLFLHQQGEQEHGRALINESLEMSTRLGNIYDIGKCHQFLAWLDSDEGNRADAIAHNNKALGCFKQVLSPETRQVRADLHKLEADVAVERPFRQEVVRAARALLSDNISWEGMHALLEREQALLLTDETDQFFCALIEQAQQSNAPDDQDRADYFAAHLFLLRDARASNISAAWARFEPTLLLDEQDEEPRGSSQAEGLTGNKAMRVAQDVSFLAEKFGLSSDDPQLPTLQRHLLDYLTEQQNTW